MKRQQKCISLSLAKELQQVAKEKGFELPESEYWWGCDKKLYCRFDKTIVDFEQQILIKKSYFDDDFEWYSAYDTSELGEILPLYYCSHREDDWYRCFGGEKVVSFKAKTEAEARGKMLVFLLKTNLKK